ncbi:MAG: SPOR domain-containing protein [Duncaniella sp.]|nr:SPOR domain-containing protein [Bacteroides sp.]MDE6065895.1 SPOR domain-containing protein [Duncaniella sp.]
MRVNHILTGLALTVCTAALADVNTVTIVDHITSGTDNTVTQPDALFKRLVPIVETTDEDTDERDEPSSRPSNGRSAGYRVQVFSDNNVRTAKAEAASKQRIISARFPQYQTYVKYTSPYWRLKVGDFKTQQEANAAADELRKAFPAYSKEIRVVRDRISLSAD